MTNEHIEADTRIIFHLKTISNASSELVVIRSNDTGVLCILVCHMKDKLASVFMDIGYDCNNRRVYTDLNAHSMALSQCVMPLQQYMPFQAVTTLAPSWEREGNHLQKNSLFAGIGQ